MGIPDHLTCLLRNCIQVNSQKLELGMEQKTGSKSEKEYVKVVYCHLAYLTYMQISVQFSSVAQCVQILVTLWITACQASLSITNSRSSLKLMSIEAMMPSNHLIQGHPGLLLPSIHPSIRVFTNESTLHMRRPKYWSFSFSIIPSKKSQGWSPSEWTGWISLQSKGLSRVFSNTTVQKHQFFGAQLSSQSNCYIHTWPLEKP